MTFAIEAAAKRRTRTDSYRLNVEICVVVSFIGIDSRRASQGV